MTFESRIDDRTRVGEYLVQCAGRPLVLVQVMPGGVAWATPEPLIRPMVSWAGQMLVSPLIELGSRWQMTAEVRGGTVTVDMGITLSIEAVEQTVDLLLPGSPFGRYRIFSFKEHVVVWLTSDGARAARAPTLETEGREYQGDGRAHETSGFVFAVGARGSLTWAGLDPDEGVPGFSMEAPAYRIDWISSSQLRRPQLDR
ncbi:hypothetical protein [Cryobacterium sp. TMT1-66-1]|uniref:hypothetical protein n=1 Tax=Cryobacterium sp. TMT1-66-1 TaxID=1259242 RepID=UPI00106DA516|nr:hypothetical protein [Cryobacterium sp. TMT1-66-1]TFD04165.1 hypothetical protein E3T29_16050 [Cryobacterium sp. TMT1-66-1]